MAATSIWLVLFAKKLGVGTAGAAFAMLVDVLNKELEEGFELLVEALDVKTPKEAGIVLPVASEVGVGIAI
jgi:hypothetical protein